MVHYNLRNEAQASGGFTDLFILGSFRNFNATTKVWGTDFTAAATTQSYDLIKITGADAIPIYILQYPIAMLVVKYPTSNSAHNLKIDVGCTATADKFLAGTAVDCETKDLVVLPAGTVAPYVLNTASQYLTALATSASGNISTLAALAANPADVGIDIWIYACLLPYREWIQNRQA